MRTRADLRRRIGHGILTLVTASTGSSLPWTASALPASAGVGPDVECVDRQRAATFGASSSSQVFAVPAGVTSMSVEVVGATGGDELDTQHELDGEAGLGGGGGRNDGTLAVSPDEVLTVVVGGEGRSAGDGAAGGGRGGGSGSFLFGPDGSLLLVSGGASGVQYGGQGGAAGFDANPGEDGADGARGGQEGTSSSNGGGGAAGSVGATRGRTVPTRSPRRGHCPRAAGVATARATRAVATTLAVGVAAGAPGRSAAGAEPEERASPAVTSQTSAASRRITTATVWWSCAGSSL